MVEIHQEHSCIIHGVWLRTVRPLGQPSCLAALVGTAGECLVGLMGDCKVFGAHAWHASPRLVENFSEKPRNTIGWQIGKGTRWHCPKVPQLGKP